MASNGVENIMVAIIPHGFPGDRCFSLVAWFAKCARV